MESTLPSLCAHTPWSTPFTNTPCIPNGERSLALPNNATTAPCVALHAYPDIAVGVGHAHAGSHCCDGRDKSHCWTGLPIVPRLSKLMPSRLLYLLRGGYDFAGSERGISCLLYLVLYILHLLASCRRARPPVTRHSVSSAAMVQYCVSGGTALSSDNALPCPCFGAAVQASDILQL